MESDDIKNIKYFRMDQNWLETKWKLHKFQQFKTKHMLRACDPDIWEKSVT